MNEDHTLKIFIIDEYHKKWNNCQDAGYQITHKQDPLQSMGIEPDHKNINGKKDNSPEGNITRKKDGGKIQNKIYRKFCTLTHKPVKHCFSGAVDKILLTVVKVVYDIS